MIVRWLALFICCVVGTAALALEIAGLPEDVGGQYDISWDVTFTKATTAPVSLATTAADGRRYQLNVSMSRISWQQLGSREAPSTAPLSLARDTRYTITLKRRPATMAVLVNHRLALCAPALAEADCAVAFQAIPAGATVTEPRYQGIESHFFGDDFMRPEAPTATAQNPWVEDSTWQVAFFHKDNPGEDPRDTKTGPQWNIPWRLSLFQVTQASTNGFWFLYTGTGPSWVVANPTMVAPFWDRYYVQAAVRPEYDSAVGLIAAYQDNRNYLLFRWKSRGDLSTTKTPRAELLAVVDGTERLLATSERGFDPGQWYTLRINLSWQRVEALVDGQLLLAGNNPGPVEGRAGLYADGAKNPRRPKLDDATATMYQATDDSGVMHNDAADEMRSTSTIYFDDVVLGDWLGVDDLVTTPFAKEKTGTWTTANGVLRAQTAGKVMTGDADWTRYTATTRVLLPAQGRAGLFIHLDSNQNGYLWTLSSQGQQLQPVVHGNWQTPVDRSMQGVKPGAWTDLRVEADGPYLACYSNGQRVLEAYDPTRASGRCGVYAGSAGVQFANFAITPLAPSLQQIKIHDGFDEDAWMVSWSSSEADWYPAVNHHQYVLLRGTNGQAGAPGPAAPLRTDIPGLYWNKGGYYGDLRVTIPVTADTVNGPVLYLTNNADITAGYSLRLAKKGDGGVATLQRGATVVGAYPFSISASTRLIFARQGSYLLLTVETLDPEDKSDDPEILSTKLLTAYHGPQPVQADMLGFTVTDAKLSAAALTVESDRLQDAFEQSPVNWVAQSGVWAVMARFSCQPKWNWFGGFGSGAPTIWNKYRLDGDQNIEVYMGIKMQFDNMVGNEAQRFRDMNVSFCADGAHLNSGYTIIRAGRRDGLPVTMLLRKGVIVQTSTAAEDQLPTNGSGHRQWFAIRIEKRGGEIKVYLDNHLSFTYNDPAPLTGGYTAFWTLNNGIMVARANLSAQRVTLGTPQAAAPLVVAENLTPGTPSTSGLATFESGFDGWQARAGQAFSGVPVRERVKTATGENTYLEVVNSYPAGDLSVTVTNTPIDLTARPLFHMDYCFDKAAVVNLYVRYQGSWYEILLTGTPAEEDVLTVGRLPITADGAWHTLQVDLNTLLTRAITAKTGVTPQNLTIQEVMIADWSAPALLRQYGLGSTPGGAMIRFDNVGFLPRTK